jgi:hypothetical protein
MMVNQAFSHYLIEKRTNEGYLFRVLNAKQNARDEFFIKLR